MSVVNTGPAPRTHVPNEPSSPKSPLNPIRGLLHVTVVEGKDLKNTDTFGKMSPVCTVQIGDVAQVTPKSKKGGSTPKWNCALKPFAIDTRVGLLDPLMIQIRVHDKDSRLGSKAVTNLVGRVHVGGGSRPCEELISREPVHRWVKLVRYSGKGRGLICLKVKFEPDGGWPEKAKESAPEIEPEIIEEIVEEIAEEDPLFGQRHAYDILRVFCDMVADAPPQAKVPLGSVAMRGIIELIVRLIGEVNDDSLLEACAASLLSLTFDCGPNIRAVADCRGIPALVKLCFERHHNGTLREACGTLRNLADEDAVSHIIGIERGVAALLHVCDSNDSEEVLEQAASALANLGNHMENCLAMCTPKAVSVLIKLCAERSHDGIHEAVTFLLRKLVEVEYTCLDWIAEAGGCAALVRLCQISSVPTVLAASARLLEELADVEDIDSAEANRCAIADADGIAPLICLCRVMHLVNATDADEGDIHEEDALEAAASTLWILARGSAERSHAIVEKGGASAMIALCNTADKGKGCKVGVLEPACGTLGDVANVKSVFQAAVAGMGAFPKLLKVCHECDDHIVLRQACWALSELACDNHDNCVSCVEEGAIPQLVRACQQFDDAFLLEQAAACLSHIARFEEFNEKLMHHDTVHALERVLTLENPTAGRLRNGAGAIANLAHDFSAGAAACIGTVVPLSDALKEICGDHETRNSPELAPVVEQINRALMNLAMEPACALKIAESGVAVPLLDLVKDSPFDPVKLSAAGALVNLSSNNDANVIVARLTGGIPPHVRLLWAEVGGEYEKVAIGSVDHKEQYIDAKTGHSFKEL